MHPSNAREPVPHGRYVSRSGRAHPVFAPAIAVLCALSLLAGGPAFSAEVTSTDDSGVGTLRQAIADAVPGETITFAVPLPATISILTTLEIDKDLIIEGPGAEQLTISGANAVTIHLVEVIAGVTAAISGLTLADSHDDPGILKAGGIYSEGVLAVENCILRDNYSQGAAGAIRNAGPHMSVTNCVFVNNSTTAFTGGIINGAGSILEVTNCTLAGNLADFGSGILWNLGDLSVSNTIIWGNAGDAIVSAGGTVTVSYSCIQGGWAGIGNIDTNPIFVSEFTNLRLHAGSPCIDSGSNAAVPAGILEDLDGNPRIVDGNGDSQAVVDMGAYEVQTPGIPGTAGMIVELKEQVGAMVATGARLPGNGQPLYATLDAALRSVQTGKLDAAKGQLRAFGNQVNALWRAGRLTTPQRDSLIADLNEILIGL
jgi:hypothetical protein